MMLLNKIKLTVLNLSIYILFSEKRKLEVNGNFFKDLVLILQKFLKFGTMLDYP